MVLNQAYERLIVWKTNELQYNTSLEQNVFLSKRKVHELE